MRIVKIVQNCQNMFCSLRENGKVPSMKQKQLKLVTAKQHHLSANIFPQTMINMKAFRFKCLDDKSLNKTTEFTNKFRHQSKLLLKNVKDSIDQKMV